MLKYVDQKIIITDEDGLVEKLSFTVKHFNKLNIDNNIILIIVNKFKENYRYSYIINKLRIFYWTRCNTIEEFNSILETRLKQNMSFTELVK